jgi:hypothetical protein
MAGGNPRLRYHCVEVIAGPHACAAAQALRGQRVLSADAPRLPLATCDRSPDCGCIYRHFDDRRMGPRRARERGRLAGPWVNTERRKRGLGRREVDYD